jgi:hypothetical protein
MKKNTDDQQKRLTEQRQREQVRQRMKRVKESKETDTKIKQIIVMKHEKVVPLEMRWVLSMRRWCRWR